MGTQPHYSQCCGYDTLVATSPNERLILTMFPHNICKWNLVALTRAWVTSVANNGAQACCKGIPLCWITFCLKAKQTGSVESNTLIGKAPTPRHFMRAQRVQLFLPCASFIILTFSWWSGNAAPNPISNGPFPVSIWCILFSPLYPFVVAAVLPQNYFAQNCIVWAIFYSLNSISRPGLTTNIILYIWRGSEHFGATSLPLVCATNKITKTLLCWFFLKKSTKILALYQLIM